MFQVYLFLLKNLYSKFIVFDIIVRADPKIAFKNVPLFIFKNAIKYENFSKKKLGFSAIRNQNIEIIKYLHDNFNLGISIIHEICLFGTVEIAEIFKDEIDEKFILENDLLYSAIYNFEMYGYLFKKISNSQSAVVKIIINEEFQRILYDDEIDFLEYFLPLDKLNFECFLQNINNVSDEFFEKVLENETVDPKFLIVSNLNRFIKVIEYFGIQTITDKIVIYHFNNIKILEYIWENNPEIIKNTEIPNITFINNTNLIKFIFKTKLKILNAQWINESLIIAARSGNFENCKILVENGADLNYKKCYAVSNAVLYGFFEIFKYFHLKGAKLKPLYYSTTKNIKIREYILKN